MDKVKLGMNMVLRGVMFGVKIGLDDVEMILVPIRMRSK